MVKKIMLIGVIILGLMFAFGACKAKAAEPEVLSDGKILAWSDWNFSFDMLYNFNASQIEAGLGKDVITAWDFLRLRGELSGPANGEIFSDSKVGIGPGVDLRILASKWGANWNLPDWTPRIGVLLMTNINDDFMKRIDVTGYLEVVKVPVDGLFNRVEKVFSK